MAVTIETDHDAVIFVTTLEVSAKCEVPKIRILSKSLVVTVIQSEPGASAVSSLHVFGRETCKEHHRSNHSSDTET